MPRPFARIDQAAEIYQMTGGRASRRPNEIAAFAPLVVLAILMGVYPSLFTDPMLPAVENLLTQIGADDPTRLAAH